ncbi:MAG TPA: hypothetical protein VKR22_15900 [Acidimicrobiales bacterium]|nr:hypothetical protein [Acidimicrobiales bacterium]
MGLLDSILGRTKPIKANLDALFALPAAAVTLQVSAGLEATGRAGVCFKPPAGQPFENMQSDLEQLLNMGADQGTTVRHVGDSFGYRWIIVEGKALDDLVTRVHMVHSSLEDAGWSTQLLCSVFGFTPGSATDVPDAVSQPMYVVYLAKRGTFYPFAPTGKEQRDSELELRVRGIIGEDLPIETDLSRWFPLWDLPIA